MTDKIILEFSEDVQREFVLVAKRYSMAAALDDIYELFRKQLKESDNAVVSNLWDEIRTIIHDRDLDDIVS